MRVKKKKLKLTESRTFKLIYNYSYLEFGKKDLFFFQWLKKQRGSWSPQGLRWFSDISFIKLCLNNEVRTRSVNLSTLERKRPKLHRPNFSCLRNLRLAQTSKHLFWYSFNILLFFLQINQPSLEIKRIKMHFEIYKINIFAGSLNLVHNKKTERTINLNRLFFTKIFLFKRCF